MLGVFEKLKQTIQESFFLKNKEKHTPDLKEGFEQNEDTTILIETSNKRIKNEDETSVFSSNVTKLSILPSLYLFINVFTIIIILFYKVKYNFTYTNDIMVGQSKIINYFNLFKANPFVYHLYTSSNSLIGILLVLSLFNVLKQKFIFHGLENHIFKLNIMFTFGFLTNFILFGTSFIPYLDNYEVTNEQMRKEFKIELSQFLFLTMIFFSISFGIYSLIAINLLSKRSEKCKNLDNWFLYKMITIIYLISFTVIYLIVYLHKNDCVSLGLNAASLSKHYNYILALFPYFIHFLNGVLAFSFYFELKSASLVLSDKIEVNYLLEDSNKNVF